MSKPLFFSYTFFCAFFCAFFAFVFVLNAQNNQNGTKRTKESELRQLERRIKLYETNNKELKELKKTIIDEIRNFGNELVTKARRISLYEQQIYSASVQIKQLEKEEAVIRKKLSVRNDFLVESLIAMQRIGNNPPPAIVVNSEKLYDAIRASKLLTMVLNSVNEEVMTLKKEIQHMLSLQDNIRLKKQDLSNNYSLLLKERQGISRVIEQRKITQETISGKILVQDKKVQQWYSQAKSLRELLDKIKRFKKAQKNTPSLRNQQNQNQLQLSIDGSFISSKGKLLFPVNGTIVKHFGQSDLDGKTSKGIFVNTAHYVQVISPVDGWVEYADDFGDYGKLIILNVGQGYRLLLAGMQHMYVQPGFFVLKGEPVGVMGDHATASLNFTSDSQQPFSVLYIELRKGNKALNLKNWWDKKS